MTTKDQFLMLLEEAGDSYVSGEQAAFELQVSRTAVWKAVEALRKDGIRVDAVRNKGYKLAGPVDVLSEAGIKKWLGGGQHSIIPDIHFQRTVTSTNTILKNMAADGAKEGYVLAAGNQTAGKGRAGRSFYSPSETGVYLSILLRPSDCDAGRASRFTTMAAVAACEAIEMIAEETAAIKWVNDVYTDGRKVAGILTEAAIDLESGQLDYAVLGIGFNVYEPEGGFPEEICQRAGCILKEKTEEAKNRLAAAFVDRFLFYCDTETGGERMRYVRQYQKRCFVPGKLINVLSGGVNTPAKALYVDDECRLIVQYEDGLKEALSAGEVSIRV